MRSYPRSEDRYPGFDVPTRAYNRWKSWATLLALTTVEGFWPASQSIQLFMAGTLAVGILLILTLEWSTRRGGHYLDR